MTQIGLVSPVNRISRSNGRIVLADLIGERERESVLRDLSRNMHCKKLEYFMC